VKKSTEKMPRRRSAPKAQTGALRATNRPVSNFPFEQMGAIGEMVRRGILTQVAAALRRERHRRLRVSLDCARPEGGFFNPPKLTALARMGGLENPPSGVVYNPG